MQNRKMLLNTNYWQSQAAALAFIWLSTMNKAAKTVSICITILLTMNSNINFLFGMSQLGMLLQTETIQ